MSQRPFSLFAVASVLALTAACASVLGIEDASCDPSFDAACAGDNGTDGSGGSEQREVLPNLGVGGSVANAGSENGVGSAVTTPPPSGGAGGASADPTSSPPANGGTAGSSMATAGAAGSAVMIDPFEARASALCRDYCSTVTANCTGTNQQYASSTACFAVCELLEPGIAGDMTSSNTVQCRLRRARLAGSTGEPVGYCFSAGPGGAEECGTDCDGYCALMTQTCPDDMGPVSQCLGACNIVPDLSRPPDNLRYNVSQTAGNSLQCRLFHVSAATMDPVTHCIHAAGGSPCSL